MLYRDGLMLVLDKPAGIPVHAGPGGGPNLEDGFDVLRYGFPNPPALAHRLDRDTSGCLVLGRHRKALARLGKLFQEGRIEKTYLAVLPVIPEKTEGTIDVPLAKVHKHKGWKMKAAAAGDAEVQSAVTDYKVLASEGGQSLIAFHPRTGRTHQLRVHSMAAFGAAIVGDTIYGGEDAGKQPRLYLHAAQIIIPLYANKPPIKVEAPLPPEFKALAVVAKWGGAL
ncbi:MAG: RNA pseudouridine synthase [Alphaproteobacteria bacterium]|nr:RNA pseudouridine synthase [Alphaproteobacteria bacterium]